MRKHYTIFVIKVRKSFENIKNSGHELMSFMMISLIGHYYLKKKNHSAKVWWYMHLVSTLGRQRQMDLCWKSGCSTERVPGQPDLFREILSQKKRHPQNNKQQQQTPKEKFPFGFNIHTYTCVYVYKYISVCICMYVYVCIHVCLYCPIYVYVYVYNVNICVHYKWKIQVYI